MTIFTKTGSCISAFAPSGGDALVMTETGKVISARDTLVLTVSGNEITDALRALGVQGDGLSSDSSFGIWGASTNLCQNGGLETNTTGWTGYGGNGVRVTTDFKFGAACLQITPAAAAGGVVYSDSGSVLTGLTPSASYTASAWVKAVSGKTIRIQLREYSAAVAFQGQSFSDIVATGSWQRVTVTRLFGASGTKADIQLFNQTDTTVFYADGVQFENLTIATPYIHTDGSSVGRSGALVGAPANLLSSAQGWFAARIRVGFSSSYAVNANVATWTAGVANLEAYKLLWFGTGSARWVMRRRSGGANVDATFGALTFAVGDILTIIGKYGSGSVGISVNGGAFVTAAASAPSLDLSAFGIGNDYILSGAIPIQGDILWFAAGTGTLSDVEALKIHNFGNTDKYLTSFPGSPSMFWAADTSAFQALTGLYGPDVTTFSDTGAPISEAKSSGADSITATDAGSVISASAASAADSLTSTETGAVISERKSSAADIFTSAETGKIVSSTAKNVQSNLILNPTFETDVNGWIPNTGGVTKTRDTTEHNSGVASMKVVTTGLIAGQGVTLDAPSPLATPNKTYVLEFYMKGSGVVEIRANGYIIEAGSAVEQFTSAPLTLTAGWNRIRYSYAFTNPSVTLQTITVRTNGTAALTFWLDDFQLLEQDTSGLFGLDVYQPAETGSMISEAKTSGADAVIASDAGSIVSALAASGVRVAQFGRPGSVISALAASGADVFTVVRSGKLISALVASGVDVYTAVETAKVVSALSASATAVVLHLRTGSLVSSLAALGSDSFTATETGKLVSEHEIFGTRVLRIIRYGAIISEAKVLGSKMTVRDRRGKIISPLSVSGLDVFSGGRKGSIVSALSALSVKSKISTQTGKLVSERKLDATDLVLYSRTGAIISPFVLSASDVASLNRSGVIASSAVLRALDAATHAREGSVIVVAVAKATRLHERFRKGILISEARLLGPGMVMVFVIGNKHHLTGVTTEASILLRALSEKGELLSVNSDTSKIIGAR